MVIRSFYYGMWKTQYGNIILFFVDGGIDLQGSEQGLGGRTSPERFGGDAHVSVYRRRLNGVGGGAASAIFRRK